MTIRVCCLSVCLTSLIVLADLFLCNSTALAQRSSGLTSEFLKTYGLSAQNVIRDLDLAPLAVEPNDTSLEITSGPKLLGDAQRVSRGGNQPLAMELFFAHIIAEYDQAQEALQAVRFSQTLRRPVWQISWAVSIAVHGGDAEKANPIPSAGSTAARGVGAAEANASAVLETALGLVATTVADEFQRRAADGEFGLTLGILHVETSAESANQPRDTRRALPTDGAEQISVDATESILQSAPIPAPIWHAGIVFLGEGTSTEIIEVARDAGVDFLLHFDVTLKTDRDKKVENSSRCRMIQVADGKVLAVSTGIDRQEADRFTRSDRGQVEDYVKEQLAPVITVIDQKASVSEMPQLTPEIAKRRVGALLSSQARPNAKRTSLRALAEIRMYQSLGLLQPSDVDAAFDYIGGEEALFLIHGPLDERLQRARQWAVDAQPAQTPP